MEHNQLSWEQIRRAFFPVPPGPSAAETERFVARVMGRIGEEAAVPWWEQWLESRWLMPALSLAAAAFFFFIANPRPESIAPLDVLLLTDSLNRRANQFLMPPDPVEADNMLALAGEEK